MHGLVLVDSSAWIGLFVARDQYHRRASDAFEKQQSEGRSFVTHDYLVAEVVTRIRIQAGLREAEQAWDLLESGTLANVVDVGRDLRQDARRVMVRFRQLTLSPADCVSIALMRRLGIRDILSFDDEFRKAGFSVHP